MLFIGDPLERTLTDEKALAGRAADPPPAWEGPGGARVRSAACARIQLRRPGARAEFETGLLGVCFPRRSKVFGFGM